MHLIIHLLESVPVLRKVGSQLLIWFICGCAIFVIAVLGVLICPTEHVFNTSGLASHFMLSPNNVFTSIWGEVFNLSKLTQAHHCVVSIVSSKSILNYGGEAADGIFPVQVCYLII